MEPKKHYFSADWHLGHENVIRFDNRPFRNVQEMDEAIMKEALSLLKPGDVFYYLGDFTFRNAKASEGYMATLASSGADMYFIRGNHDKKDTVRLYEKYGTYLGEQKGIKVGEQHIILNHFAMRVWNRSHHGSFHFYAHSHDALEKVPWGKSCDVGIPTAYRIKGKYTLFEYEELAAILQKRETKIIDQHGR